MAGPRLVLANMLAKPFQARITDQSMGWITVVHHFDQVPWPGLLSSKGLLMVEYLLGNWPKGIRLVVPRVSLLWIDDEGDSN